VLKKWAHEKFLRHKAKSPKAIINISCKFEALKSLHKREREELSQRTVTTIDYVYH